MHYDMHTIIKNKDRQSKIYTDYSTHELYLIHVTELYIELCLNSSGLGTKDCISLKVSSECVGKQ